MRARLFLVCCWFCLCAVARAGDAANLELIGFSQNGSYLAFEQFGVQDGSGFPYSQLSVVQVARNALMWSAEARINNDSSSVTSARAALRSKSETALRRYGIQRGAQGIFLGVAAARDGFQESNFVAFGRTYTLSRSLSAAPLGQCAAEQPPQLLELTLHSASLERVLQRDTRLPSSRACAYGYEMRSAHLYKRSLAVFLSVTLPGFEGPDLRWMVVTAAL